MYIGDLLIEINPIKDEPKDNKPKKDVVNEYVVPDVGELLVIQRSLYAKIQKEESWQQDALFHTRCTSYGKVCSMIIDSGSCTNIVSEEMVTQLGLRNEKYPQPYNIHWL